MPLPPNMSRAARATSSALPQELRLSMEVISPAALPTHITRQTQTALQRQTDLGLHIGQFLLDELIGGERTAELLAIQHILPRRMPATLGGAERAPRYPVTRGIETGEGTLEPGHVRQQIFFRNEHLVHEDLPGDRRAQSHFAVNGRRRETFPAFFENESANDIIVRLGPHDE